MNTKRFVIASLTVCVSAIVLDTIIHGVILRGAYEATKSVWRPDMESKVWIFWLINLIVSFPFTYLFVKGYEGKGIMEGARFGAVMGVYAAVPMAYGMYTLLPVPYSMAAQWFAYGVIEIILLGMVAALVYKPKRA
ncbi:MAG: hypothetical protein NTY38_32495 [Acidobacteria bacterium]|nr:hypothetical protein [Acidobacteriota bacterium]